MTACAVCGFAPPRMASQFVAKSQIVNRWGGATIWVVQDALTDYIASNTGIV